MVGKRKWTSEAIIEAIKEAYEKKGSPVYDKWMDKNGYSSPLSRIKKDGKSLAMFAEENGIGHLVQVLYTTKGYSEEFIVNKFKELYLDTGEKLCDAVLRKHHNKYLAYLRKHYGGLTAFIDKHNLNEIFEVRYSHLTNEEVVERVRNFSAQAGRKICMRDLQDNLSSCSQYIYRNYGDFESYCEANDLLDIFEYKGGVSWTDESAVSEIVALYNKSGSKLSLSALKAEKLHGLIHYIRRNFDGMSDFVNKLELHDYVYVSDFLSACGYGDDFERLVKQAFDILGYTYEYQSRKFEGIRPDFYLEESDIIIDSKLSSHTAFNLTNGFFEKYTKQCSKLVILYLRGSAIQKREGKVEFKCVSDYYDALTSAGRKDLVDEFEKLKLSFEKAKAS
jgi:hypothetical protein